MNPLIVVLLVLLLVGALPTWPYSSGWGYYPSGGLGLLLIVLIIVLLTRGRPGLQRGPARAEAGRGKGTGGERLGFFKASLLSRPSRSPGCTSPFRL